MNRSSPWRVALNTPSVAGTFSERRMMRATRPSEDGLWELAGDGGGASPGRVKILPFCLGAPGTCFYVGVVGWSRIVGGEASGGWVGTGICDLLVCAGDIPGFTDSLGEPVRDDPRVVPPVANLAGVVYLAAGSLGAGDDAGYLVNYGYQTRMAAFAVVPTHGAQLIQFDFSPDPFASNTGSAPMNALWASL